MPTRARPPSAAPSCGAWLAASAQAHAAGLAVHAGHGLDRRNYPAFAAALPVLHEVSIGFSVIAHALFVGMDRAVRDMHALVTSRSAVR